MTTDTSAPRLRATGRAFEHIARFHPELTAFRRDLHAHPELGFEEVYTSARVREALKLCGVDEIHEGLGKTGVVAVIHGQRRDSGRLMGLRALTGEDLPYATLVYVWSNKLPQDSTLNSPRSDRIRKIVLESGTAHLGQWLSYERDIRADYERCYGEAPGPLIGVAIMTDTDNTRSHSQAWYGPVRLQLKPAPKP